MKTGAYIFFSVYILAAGAINPHHKTPPKLHNSNATKPQPPTVLFLEKAREQIGVVEQPLGSNRGPEVDAYNKSAGAPLGSPWCASVQHWTGKQIGVVLPNAWSPSWFPKARIIPREQVRAGDFLGVPSQKMERIAHIAVVERVEGNRVITLEGNTNAEGSREGHGYFRRSRLINSNVFSRWFDD